VTGSRDNLDDAGGHGCHPAADPTSMHAAVRRPRRRPARVVDTVVGVRTESTPTIPTRTRASWLSRHGSAALNAALYDEIHHRLGLHPDLTTLTWSSRWTQTDPDAARPQAELDTFSLGSS